LVIKSLEPDPDSLEMLDMDPYQYPDLDSMNTVPQLWLTENLLLILIEIEIP
jgi:hypothetical protein